MGKDRVAFDETLAKNSIEHQGYYLIRSRQLCADARESRNARLEKGLDGAFGNRLRP